MRGRTRSGVAVLGLALVLSAVTATASSAGTAWTIVPSPSPPDGSEPKLVGVSCVATTTCTAVGTFIRSGRQKTLVEQWDGAAWTIVPSPNVADSGLGPPSADSELLGVSCPAVSNCTAVGDSQMNFGGTGATLVEHWDGMTWTVVPSPNTAAPFNKLAAVSCPSVSSCTAVGDSETISSAATSLVEHWDGMTWTIVPTSKPDVGAEDALFGVWCTEASSCTAVGSRSVFSGRSSLIEQWDGGAWKIVMSPNIPSADFNTLSAVTCVATTSCTAVGESYNRTANATTTLIEQWDGSGWTIVASPNPAGNATTSLGGISCGAATSCVAVGTSNIIDNGVFKSAELLEQWDGTTWTIAAFPHQLPASTDSLFAVSCPVPTSCAAVGSVVGSREGTLVDSTGAFVVSGPTTTTSTSTTTSSTTTSTTTTSTTTSSSTTSTTTSTSPSSVTTTTIGGMGGTATGPTVEAQPSTVVAGQSVSVSGTGFPGGAQLQIVLFSDPVVLGTTTADSGGTYRATVTIPASVAPRAHVLVVSPADGAPEARTSLTVTSADGGTTASTATTQTGALSFTGSNVRRTAGIAVVLGLTGLALIVATRRRSLWWRRRG
ncbi:MAG: hypothetical protein M3083_09470 [Actinomycetota bacterium]|nr:hypothetical protein [Actinomycetota bacterium]